MEICQCPICFFLPHGFNDCLSRIFIHEIPIQNQRDIIYIYIYIYLFSDLLLSRVFEFNSYTQNIISDPRSQSHATVSMKIPAGWWLNPTPLKNMSESQLE